MQYVERETYQSISQSISIRLLRHDKMQANKSKQKVNTVTHTHTRLTARFSGTTRVSRYQNGKTNLDFTEARESEWQWHQLGHI